MSACGDASDPAGSLEAESGAESCIARLPALSARGGYNRAAALRLIEAAKGAAGESWNDRCLAILLLEGQLLQLPADDRGEAARLFAGIGIEREQGIGLLPRMARLSRAHRALLSDPPQWMYFLRVAREVSKLTLAPYFFTPEETRREIFEHLRTSSGVENAIPGNALEETFAWIERHPAIAPFERELLRRLCEGRRIYWVSERCSSELNELVEYPLTSAALVIKPPGSDREIEIKRTGARGERLLNVISMRNGKEAPTSHRLFGGSLGWLAQRETRATRIFDRIYRLVHGVECPSCLGVMNSSVATLPAADGEIHLLDYLTCAERFGEGFEEARASMASCVKTFPWDTGVPPASYSGEAGETLQFIGQALPEQAILIGSSSFRLDRIDLYLSDRGADEYFGAGLGRDYLPYEARWFADAVLEEILGEIAIPPLPYAGHAQYLRDVFRFPANRARADATYLDVMRQIGEYWGTLLAVRGFSDGESFVLRNVGLKSAWQDGSWRVRIIFMDHDDLTVAGSRYRHLWPWREASGMDRDRVHILGGPIGGDVLPGEAGALRSIYRVTDETSAAGLQALENAAALAYRHTQEQLDSNPALKALFDRRLLDGHRDFDQLVPWFLRTSPDDAETWKAEAAAYLRNRGYDEELAAEYARTVTHFADHFRRLAFLYK